MNKKDIIEFFDRCAPFWDADMVTNDEIIGTILNNAEVKEGQHVLDVACGTGVMFPYYMGHNAGSITGIDISPKMAAIAAEKFAEFENIQVLCGDVEEVSFDKKFDLIMVYNALPHFPEPERLIAVLSAMLKDGGRLCVAHGASRKTIDSFHIGAASAVSRGLMEADVLAEMFSKHLETETVISDDKMYQVSGVKI